MSLPIMSTSEAERIAWMAGIWEEAAAFCAAARDGVDFASLTESTARQEGAFDMADHLAATFKEMAEGTRRREARNIAGGERGGEETEANPFLQIPAEGWKP